MQIYIAAKPINCLQRYFDDKRPDMLGRFVASIGQLIS